MPRELGEIVARFFAARQRGQRPGIDELLPETLGSSEGAALRSQVLEEIVRRTRGAARQAADETRWSGPAEPAAPELPELPGYDLVDLVGRGGMGMVYEAYQRSTGRRVAVKLILPAALNDAARRRFAREVELIARLEHPHIVTVLDSGVQRGHYYYVMEYIAGQPLDAALLPGTADPRDVLRVMATVAAAVDYAHQRGVLHRDLKPSNILLDERGEPRLVDFGLGKAIDGGSSDVAVLSVSEPGQLVGTLAYMAPEQARGDLAAQSLRTDVYALAAVTYELLAGALPCPTDGALGDVLRRIAEQDPLRPSARRPGLGRDIDAVLLKGLEKRPEARYATAGDFAADLQHCLADEPVTARRIGPLGRGVRWIRRHRTISAISAAALALVAIAATISALQVEAAHVRMTARLAARRQMTEQMSDAMQRMLQAGDPDLTPGVWATPQQLDQWEPLLAEFRDEPSMEMWAGETFARLALQSGQYRRAAQHLDHVVELRRAAASPPELARALFYRARAQHKLGEYAVAETDYRAAAALRETLQPPQLADLADSLSGLAWVLKDQDHYAEAESLYRRALALLENLPGDLRFKRSDALHNLAQLLTQRGAYAEAEQDFRAALDLRHVVFNGDHQHVASTMANLGSLLREQGAFDEAEEKLRAALAMRTKLLGPEHATTVVSMNLLGLLLKDRGKYAEAETVLRRALELRIKALGTTRHDFVAVSQHNLASVLQARGQYAEAEQLLLAALETWRQVLPNPERHHNVAAGYQSLAELYRATGRLAEARELCERSLAIRRAIYAPDTEHLEIGSSLLLAGRIALAAHDPTEAEPLLRHARQILGKLPPGHWRIALCDSVLGECLTATGCFAEAEPLLLSSFEVLQRRAPVPQQDTRDALDRLVALYSAWQRPADVARFAALQAATPR